MSKYILEVKIYGTHEAESGLGRAPRDSMGKSIKYRSEDAAKNQGEFNQSLESIMGRNLHNSINLLPHPEQISQSSPACNGFGLGAS